MDSLVVCFVRFLVERTFATLSYCTVLISFFALLIAVVNAAAASKILMERVADLDQISNVCLLQEAALAAYEEGKDSEVVKLTELGSEIRKVAQITLSTLELLRYASMSEEDREKEYGEDAEEDGTPFDRFYGGKALETSYALYWPNRFLSFLQDQTKAKEEKEEE